MSEISTLQPQLLWHWFDQICAIPHPSYHEQRLAQFILDWATEKGLFAERDEAGNILIRKAASVGMENRPTIALQAHLDMVPQANEGTQHDFIQDPILPYIDGDWVKAKGTTLGADNGIGLASCLAVLDSENLVHPPLEVLLTMTEEAGMDGAKGLRENWLQSELMVNTDTEENGEIYIGCAGGLDAKISIPLSFQPNKYQHQYQISLKGLRGGHSGCDIHTGRVNAIKLLARFLVHLTETQPQFEFTLSHIRGGSVRNAIPREAAATIAFDHEPALLQSAMENFQNLIQSELAVAEPNAQLSLQPAEKSLQVFESMTTRDVIHLVNALPNGVMRWSDSVAGVVESSLSMGILNTEENEVSIALLIRSLNESGKQYIQEMLVSLIELSGDDIRFSGNYPGWNPDVHSPLTDLTKQIYDDILGSAAQIKVIHAGLECGLIKEKYPNLDVVSIGPTIVNAHSPDEKVHIPAVATYWQLLTRLLAEIPAK